VPAAPSKFTLSIFSPNNTGIYGPNQTDINGLGVVSEKLQYVTGGGMLGVSSLDQKLTEFWLNSKGWLTDAEKNGTWRHAYITTDDLKTKPIAAAISFEQLDNSNDWTYSGPPVWLKWEITSDDLLIPAGSLKGLPWFYCQNIPSPEDPVPDENLGGTFSIGKATNNCTTIQGLKVTKSD
jgi:hypothetical protein